MPDNFAAMATSTIPAREIFAAGTWTDADGNEREWTDKDLATIIRKFNGETEPIPLKAGHTEDGFNNRIADQLNIPNSLVTGDEGNGAIRFGVISSVASDGSTLTADFGEVPEVIKNLIEGGQYNQVSCEITLEEDGPRLTAVALLGAEPPAVKGMQSISQGEFQAQFRETGGDWVTIKLATNMDGDQGDGRPNKQWWERAVAALSMFPGLGKAFDLAGQIWYTGHPFPRATFDTPESAIMAVPHIQEFDAQNTPTGGNEEMTMNPEQNPSQVPEHTHDAPMADENTADHVLAPEELPIVYQELELPDTATIEDVVGAIRALKQAAGVGGEEGGPPPAEDGMMTEEAVAAHFAKSPTGKAMLKQVENQGLVIQQFQRREKVAKFQSMTEKWTSITGTPEELAEKLTKIEETAGAEAVADVVSMYQATHEDRTAASLLAPLGSSRPQVPSQGDEFTAKVEALAEKEGISPEKAFAQMSQKDPEGFAVHVRSMRAQQS